MAQILVFVVLGLGSGALISGIATGLVVMYRGSGIINLAMERKPWSRVMRSGRSRTAEFGFTLGTWPAAILAVAIVVLVGALMELLAFRWLRTAAPLAKIVASLGILLFLTSAFTLMLVPEPVNEPTVLPSGAVSVGTDVPEAGLIVAGAVLIVSHRVDLHISLHEVRPRHSCCRGERGIGDPRRSVAEQPRDGKYSSGLFRRRYPRSVGWVFHLARPFHCPVAGDPRADGSAIRALYIYANRKHRRLLIGSGENLMYYASVQSWFPKDQGAPLPRASTS